jgi:hypothetical protein
VSSGRVAPKARIHHHHPILLDLHDQLSISLGPTLLSKRRSRPPHALQPVPCELISLLSLILLY